MTYKKQTNEAEYRAYGLLAGAKIPVPPVLHYDAQNSTLTLEDVSDRYVSGNTDWGRALEMLDTLADMHIAFWDNYDAFGKVGLPWRLDHPKNFAQHCKAMEKGIKPYCKAHKMDDKAFRQALNCFRTEMPKLLESRFHAGKNITVLHGDAHPGNILLPKEPQNQTMLVDLEAVRMGLAAEDLSMLFGLHIAPEKAQAMPLLEHYYERLTKHIKSYAFETLLEDYRVALAESLFFPQKLYLEGVANDTVMMSRALKAWADFG
ncbi:MAG: phosphotransferase [Oscillospiraceae bacterium]|nr:phosphotransferase [Oscillospiraceae bacterium]